MPEWIRLFIYAAATLAAAGLLALLARAAGWFG